MHHEVFVDAGAWIAIAVPRDAYHQPAVEQYRQLLRESRVLVTTNLVVGEAYAIIRRAAGHTAGIRFLRSLRESTRLMKIYSTAVHEEPAEQILDHYTDQDFSFVDAVSFAVMHQRGVGEAFAFDRHFLTAGFAVMPGLS